MSYLKGLGRRRDQTSNSEGYAVWAVDEWARLRRFLVLGSEGGSYYASQRALTRENALVVEACLETDGPRTVREIVAVSKAGRAPKNEPALFALAMAAGAGDEVTRRAALDALPHVARTATHLFAFIGFVGEFRGWGRGLRRGIAEWYTGRTPDALAYQAVKYRARGGMTHRDALRLAHPESETHADLFEWIVRGTVADGLPAIVAGYLRAQSAQTPAAAAELIREFRLPREAVPTALLTSPEVWDALLEDMPMTAMMRNLATMTRVGVIAPGSAGTARVTAQLADEGRLRRARVHPIAVLAALRTYQAGRGVRGSGTWNPVRDVVDALDGAFYASFGNVEPTGGRTLLALDVSGSMTWGAVAGVPGLTPRDASAALALVTAATESQYEIVAFHAGRRGWKSPYASRFGGREDGLTPLAVSPRQRLDDVIATVNGLPFGGTDCALPMLYAKAQGREVDTFVIYTDSETWAGNVAPAQALREYRRASGIDARLVVVGMVANAFTIADPDDPGMLDVVGFDTGTPQLISEFARGAV